ncbi:MAG: DUF305 domain-containing protein [Gemmatimonadaceae bacterium]|nr:DUF305 domain-containing protein [Gemmatimonadaceae bacterium]
MLDRSIALAIALSSATLLLAACSKSDSGSADTGQATVAGMPADTGMGSMAGMDHSTMASTPARDPDQEFLRMMVDHHNGLLAMADTALAKNPSEHIRMDVREMKQKQAPEMKRMVGMLKNDYGEDKMPMVTPSNAQMISEVASKSGTDLERTFREKVIAHHEEALKMIGDYEPKFTRPAVRTMAAKMKSDQQKEIAELKSELNRM